MITSYANGCSKTGGGMATTINEIARKAKVSASTVSRVLNSRTGTVPISKATQERVRRIARELNYFPNVAARALTTRRTQTIAMLGSSEPFFVTAKRHARFASEAINGVINCAMERGYHVTLLTGNESEDGAADELPDIGLSDGVVAFNREFRGATRSEEMLLNCGKPVVYVLTYPDVPGAYAACPDDEQGGARATDELLRAGHERIAFVRRKDYYPGVFDRRQRGWASALEAAGGRAEPEWIVDESALTAEWIREKRISACVCGTDRIAGSVRERLEGDGLRIPDDLAVVTFSYEPAPKDSPPLLAAVRASLVDIVYAGTGMLIDLIEDGKPERMQRFPFTYTPGGSAGSLADH
jgi:DNA-binding LacI/PurR family transcriptional regulator